MSVQSAMPATARITPAPRPALRVAPVDAALAAAVRALRVTPEQLLYVGDIAYNLADAQRDPLSDAMAVLAGDEVIGFYRIGRAPRTVIGRALDQPHLGLRAFMIDRAHQGRGQGTRAIRACCIDARRRHPRYPLLALTVDCRNVAAVAAYRRAGFDDSGELVPGGSAGPQHVMLYRLHDLVPLTPAMP